jgi:parvulin-like peptidyl-prolyl isomerase
MRTVALALTALLSLPAAAQTQQPPAAADKPIATVNAVPIKPALFQQALQQAIAQGRPDTPQLREAIADQLIARELFVQAAAKQGLDKDAEVLAIAEEAKRSAMVQRYLRQALKPNPITEEQVKAQYEKVRSSLGPKEYKLRVMLLPNDVRARSMRAELADGKDFAQLARQWSLAPSATRGGELDWVSFKSPAKEGETSGLPLLIAQAVEKLAKGRVSDPIAVQGKWWLIKLDDVRPTTIPSYEQARQGITNMLAAQDLERATAALVKQLSQGATITR